MSGKKWNGHDKMWHGTHNFCIKKKYLCCFGPIGTYGHKTAPMDPKHKYFFTKIMGTIQSTCTIF